MSSGGDRCAGVGVGQDMQVGLGTSPEVAGGRKVRENLESSQPGEPRPQPGEEDQAPGQGFSTSAHFTFWTIT